LLNTAIGLNLHDKTIHTGFYWPFCRPVADVSYDSYDALPLPPST
jgi:hypothetical protein